MRIRKFQPGDEESLYVIYYSAIHQTAIRDYTPEQINAWAPMDIDMDGWSLRIQGIQPFVIENRGRLLAYADLQPSGYIDHFYVSGDHSRQGLGRMLMEHILQEAWRKGIPQLTSNVSRTAQPFFARFGFSILEQRVAVVRGVAIPNALMSLNQHGRPCP